jgi:hypothetical protein
VPAEPIAGGNVDEVVVVDAASAPVGVKPRHATPSATTTNAARLVACPP